MTSERSKRRDFLSLIFIAKSISKKLLIKMVNFSSNNMHFLIMTVWKGLMGEKLAKKYISNKGECLSP